VIEESMNDEQMNEADPSSIDPMLNHSALGHDVSQSAAQMEDLGADVGKSGSSSSTWR
jgi:hypothetical protein